MTVKVHGTVGLGEFLTGNLSEKYDRLINHRKQNTASTIHDRTEENAKYWLYLYEQSGCKNVTEFANQSDYRYSAGTLEAMIKYYFPEYKKYDKMEFNKQNAIYWWKIYKKSNANSIREFVKQSDYKYSIGRCQKLFKEFLTSGEIK